MYPDYDNVQKVFSDIDYNQVILDEDESRSEGASSLGTFSVSPEATEDARQMGLSLDAPPGNQEMLDQLLSGSLTSSEAEDQEIRERLEENRRFDPNRATTYILIDILASSDERKSFFETVSICEKVFDQLLAKGALTAIVEFIHTIRQQQERLMSQKPDYADRLGEFIRRAGDDRRIGHLTDIINSQEIIDTDSIEVYFDSLGQESLAHITGMLGRLVSKKARLMVCDYLARRGKDQLQIIANGLRDQRWFVVRNTVMILGRIGGDRALRYLAATAAHPDHRVRREVITAVAQNVSEEAIEIVCGFLKDGEPELRAIALDSLGRMKGRRPFETIRNIIQSSYFAGYPVNEQEQFLIAYSSLGGEEVTDFLASIIGSFSLFNAGWKARYRLMALKALAHNTSEEAQKLILKYTRSRRPWLRQAAVTALELRRKIIYQKERVTGGSRQH
jgi:hypothetical protein